MAIRDGLVGGFEIADDAESKSITLYGKDATLYWGEDQECAGETGTEAYIFQIDEENGWLINFRSFKLSPGRACLRRRTGQNLIVRLHCVQ